MPNDNATIHLCMAPDNWEQKCIRCGVTLVKHDSKKYEGVVLADLAKADRPQYLGGYVQEDDAGKFAEVGLGIDPEDERLCELKE